MKRFIALLFCLILAVSLAGCTGTDKDSAATLQVGFGREDITPEYSVPLGGTGGVKVTSFSTADPLYATCVAFTDGDDNTILLYHMDLINSGGIVDMARDDISEATGIPMQNIMLAATHTHSGPTTSSGSDIMDRYRQELAQKMVSAAQAALADRKQAEMYTATTTLKNLSFVRHYNMSDGSVAGSNFGNTTDNDFVSHVREPDNEMQLIRFKREGGKDVVLVNWQCHPNRYYSATNTALSADIVGAMRMSLEPMLDCYMAYFTGGSGDIAPQSSIVSENITASYMEQGAMLAQGAALACDTMTQQKAGKVQILYRTQKPVAGKNEVSLATYAFSIGDVAFITAPYEMFDTNGEFIKDNSPFSMTFIVTCANGHAKYIPAEWAYYEDIVAYETSTGCGGFNKGEAEKLADTYVEMLSEIYPTRGSAEFSPATGVAANLYYNLDHGKELTADENGVYTVNMFCNGEQMALKVTDETVKNTLQGMDFMGLTLNGDTITGIVHMADMPCGRLTQDYPVVSVGGTTVKATSPDGRDLVQKLPEGIPVYDVVPDSGTFGGTTTVQKNDCITIVADNTEKQTPIAVYVTRRPAIPHEGLLYCEHCKKEVEWLDWISDYAMPASDGHYRLTKDINLTANGNVYTGDICLDLNGRTVTQTSFATRIYALHGDVTLSIMDSAGKGRMIPASAEAGKGGYKWGMIIQSGSSDAVVNLYSGTLDASAATAQYGSAINQAQGIFNMYGGTILGGHSYGSGGSALRADGIFNMYGGKISGGTLNTTLGKPYPSGGAVVRIGGTMNMYGGIIEGGDSYIVGGAVYASSSVSPGITSRLFLYGGTITGGKAATGGSGVYVAGDAYITIGGDIKITGNQGDNLYLARGVTIAIGEEGLGENAEIGITMEEPGEFITGVPKGVNISKIFTSDDTSKKITGTGSGSWGLK